MTTAFEVMEKGGKWLGAAREYLQTHALFGDSLEWGSNDVVKGLTVRDIEQLGADAVAADRKERNAEWKERKTIRAWAIVKPDGKIVFDSEFVNEADAWQVVLGWPGDGEIAEAKVNGYRAVLATVII